MVEFGISLTTSLPPLSCCRQFFRGSIANVLSSSTFICPFSEISICSDFLRQIKRELAKTGMTAKAKAMTGRHDGRKLPAYPKPIKPAVPAVPRHRPLLSNVSHSEGLSTVDTAMDIRKEIKIARLSLPQREVTADWIKLYRILGCRWCRQSQTNS